MDSISLRPLKQTTWLFAIAQSLFAQSFRLISLFQPICAFLELLLSLFIAIPSTLCPPNGVSIGHFSSFPSPPNQGIQPNTQRLEMKSKDFGGSTRAWHLSPECSSSSMGSTISCPRFNQTKVPNWMNWSLAWKTSVSYGIFANPETLQLKLLNPTANLLVWREDICVLRCSIPLCLASNLNPLDFQWWFTIDYERENVGWRSAEYMRP